MKFSVTFSRKDYEQRSGTDLLEWQTLPTIKEDGHPHTTHIAARHIIHGLDVPDSDNDDIAELEARLSQLLNVNVKIEKQL